jgi:hypothetical protein
MPTLTQAHFGNTCKDPYTPGKVAVFNPSLYILALTQC